MKHYWTINRRTGEILSRRLKLFLYDQDTIVVGPLTLVQLSELIPAVDRCPSNERWAS